jgi:hypothetical protein
VTQVPKTILRFVDWDSWVLLGHLAGTHGFPKDGIFSYKVRLLNPGSEALREARVVGLIQPAHRESDPFNSCSEELALANPCSALGGKWGQNSEVLLRSPRDLSQYKSWGVGMPRRNLPDPEEPRLSDLIGFEVWESLESESQKGKIISATWANPKSSSVLGFRDSNEQIVSVPIEWVDWPQSEALWEKNLRVVCVPGVSQWNL